MATEVAIPGASAEQAAMLELLSLGIAEVRVVPPEEGREDHLAAWALRAARVDPDRLDSSPDALPADAGLLCQAHSVAAQARVARGEGVGDAWPRAVSLLPKVPDPEQGLHLLNDLCETAIEVAAKDESRSVELLSQLAGQQGEAVPDWWPGPHRALALALLGEAMLALGESRGAGWLEQAIALAGGYPVSDQVLVFSAQSLATRDPSRARSAAGSVSEPSTRLQARTDLIRRAAAEGSVPEDLLDAARNDTSEVEGVRRCESLARLAVIVREASPGMGGRLLQEALDAIPPEPLQLRALQLAGTAAAIGTWDREWSNEVYSEATATAEREPELVRSVIARIAIAFQLGATEPVRAQVLLDEALAQARALDSTWELGHVLELVFDPRGRPELDLSAAVPLLQAAEARVSEDDLRLPGVFGLPELARCWLQLDPQRAAALHRRRLAAAEQTGDTESALDAGLTLCELEPDCAGAVLKQIVRGMAERLDCVALSRFCQAAADREPDLATRIAAMIPESRERTRSLAACAAALWRADPAVAGQLVSQIPAPAERSAALLGILDRHFGTADLPRPLADSEFNSCCSGIPQLDPSAAKELFFE